MQDLMLQQNHLKFKRKLLAFETSWQIKIYENFTINSWRPTQLATFLV